jgi:polygalacturonase
MRRRHFFASLAATTSGAGALLGANVREFGATGDGLQLETGALQKSIDSVSEKGGGTVLLPPGRYLSGTLRLRTGVTLYLAAGSVLLGSRDLAHYPELTPSLHSYTDNYTNKSLIYAEDAQRLAIHGDGLLDGQGANFKGPYKVRPYMIRMIRCRDVSIRDIRLADSPMWVQHYLECEDVEVRGIHVRSRVNHNNDGLDIDACSRVRISGCDISSGDDAIVLKSTTSRPCRDITISDCVLSSACNALKLGTESNGGFEDIVINNCAVYDTRLAGLALECVDGGTLARVIATNLTMRQVGCPLFIRLGDRARPFAAGQPRPGVGTLRDITVANLYATASSNIGCAISGLPGHPIRNLYLSNLDLEFPGGGEAAWAQREPAEEPEKYPEFTMFGPLPAYGIWSRHVRGLTTRDLRMRTRQPDARPATAQIDAE